MPCATRRTGALRKHAHTPCLDGAPVGAARAEAVAHVLSVVAELVVVERHGAVVRQQVGVEQQAGLCVQAGLR
eukprot:203745-Chlamydomonas_euryale.AAC.3